MTFSKLELARIEKLVGGFCERRVPPEVRDKVRLEYSIKRHDVEICEVRPAWRDPNRETRTPLAKLRFVRTAGEWRLFWMRKDLRWHSYQPFPSSRDLEEILAKIDRDEWCCFFG